jgi:zinc protease
MKTQLSWLLALGLAVPLAACGDSTPPPVAPAPAPPAPVAAPAPVDPPTLTEGDVTVGWSRGMEILVKRDPTAEFVSGQLYIRGGTRNWTKDNAGIEDVALDVATGGGTRSLDKEAFSRKLASLGGSIGGSSLNDYATISAKSPRSAWNELFPLFVDTFLAPALPESEFAVVKQRALSARRHETEDGDGRLRLLARKALFAGHPYANRAVGTVETISAMKPSDLAPHLAKLRDTKRLVLIVVGDVDPAKVIEQARAAFASVPSGTYVETPIPQLHFEEGHLLGDSFKLPTNYIQAMFAAPSWNDPDFVPMRLAMSLLGERVWDEVRTKRNLSYAPSARFDYDFAAPFGHLYVTAVDPAAAMKVMFDEARRLQTELIPAKELEGAKNVFVTSYLKGHETTDGQASVLGEALLLGGDWHRANTFPARLKATTPEQVRAAATRWLNHFQTAIVGDPSKLDPQIVRARQVPLK